MGHFLHVLLLFDLLSLDTMPAGTTATRCGLNRTAPLFIPKLLLFGSPDTRHAAIAATECHVFVLQFWRMTWLLFAHIGANGFALHGICGTEWMETPNDPKLGARWLQRMVRARHALLDAGGVTEICRWSSEHSERKPPDPSIEVYPPRRGRRKSCAGLFRRPLRGAYPGDGDPVVFASLDPRLVS